MDAGSGFEAVRDALLRHGGSWKDVASRYEALWRQHYGTSDATWERIAPVYSFGWYEANDARYPRRAPTPSQGAARKAIALKFTVASPPVGWPSG